MQQLNQLKDIHLPEPITWWPLALGWWMLFGGIIVALVIIYFIIKIQKKRQLKKTIKTELMAIKQHYEKTENKVQLAKSLSALLRRASISYYPQKNIAGLTKKDWLQWLDKTHQHKKHAHQFLSETGKVLLSVPYQPNNAKLDYNAMALYRLCESWLLATHKPMKDNKND